MAGIPALPKSHFGKKWSYEVLTAQRRHVILHTLREKKGKNDALISGIPDHLCAPVQAGQGIDCSQTNAFIFFRS